MVLPASLAQIPYRTSFAERLRRSADSSSVYDEGDMEFHASAFRCVDGQSFLGMVVFQAGPNCPRATKDPVNVSVHGKDVEIETVHHDTQG